MIFLIPFSVASFFDPLQADLAAAFGTDSKVDEDGSDDGAGSSSESSVLGLGAQPTRRMRQKTTPAAPHPGPSLPPKNNNASTPGPARVPPKSSQTPALSMAHTALQGVQQLSPSALWKGMFKDGECKVRLKKAGQAITDLEQFQATLVEESSERADCARVLSKLSAHIATASRGQDVIGKLRSKKVLDHLCDADFQKDFATMCHGKGMEADTFSLIVHYIGGKVVEAGSWYLNASFFCCLLSCQNRSQCGLVLGHLFHGSD